MDAVKDALERLNESLGKLEHSIETVQIQKSGGQVDMFSAPINAPSNQNSQAAIAKRLDSAIEQVEKILSESQG